MARQWDEWFRRAREEGMTRQEVRDHLRQQGYNADQLMEQYWPAQTDDTDLQRQARQPAEREEDLQTTTQGYTDTVLTVFSSPSGFFRRLDPDVGAAARFAAANIAGFLILNVLIGTLIGLLLGGGLVGSATASLIDGGLLAGGFVLGAAVLTLYLGLVFVVLKSALDWTQVLVSVLYASFALLITWPPIIGRFLGLYGFYTVYTGVEEQVESKLHSFTLIFAPAVLVAVIAAIASLL
ncbi:MAG: hypothetical protein SV186_06770 [Candidatus Nanohaloarchaea archaeon]|nr:hypothetical protein [Candidatus Nanohaloarchaea archaeon]